MVKWDIEQEEYYYKIYDAKKELVGYFQPDYGEIHPAEKQDEIINEMLRRQDNVYGGVLHVPLLKLNLVNEEHDYDLDYVLQNLDASIARAERWKECLRGMSSISFARARKSHSDPDMLSLLLGIKFAGPVKLNKDNLLNALQPILDRFHEKKLL